MSSVDPNFRIPEFSLHFRDKKYIYCTSQQVRVPADLSAYNPIYNGYQFLELSSLAREPILPFDSLFVPADNKGKYMYSPRLLAYFPHQLKYPRLIRVKSRWQDRVVTGLLKEVFRDTSLEFYEQPAYPRIVALQTFPGSYEVLGTWEEEVFHAVMANQPVYALTSLASPKLS